MGYKYIGNITMDAPNTPKLLDALDANRTTLRVHILDSNTTGVFIGNADISSSFEGAYVERGSTEEIFNNGPIYIWHPTETITVNVIAEGDY